MNYKESISKFIKEFEEVYPVANLKSSYNEDEEHWQILYDDLALLDIYSFYEVLGRLTNKYFYDKGMYNISFNYKEDKWRK